MIKTKLCKRCNGSGRFHEISSYTNDIESKCYKCKGIGKLTTLKFNITMPYTDDYKLINEIIDLIENPIKKLQKNGKINY